MGKLRQERKADRDLWRWSFLAVRDNWPAEEVQDREGVVVHCSALAFAGRSHDLLSSTA
jgi:hypothetical protein